MGLFSKYRKIRSTREVETLREVFKEDYKVYVKVEQSDDLKRFRELETYVNSSLFRNRKKEIEQLTYKGSDDYKAEKNYKRLLGLRPLRDYYLIRDSRELAGYLKMKESSVYDEYMKLYVVVKSVGFDKKLHRAEFDAYKRIVKDPKIKALISFEKNRKFRHYDALRQTGTPAEFERLCELVNSENFKANRAYLLNKNRYLTTDDYKLSCEYETLKKRPDMVKFFSLNNDPIFTSMCRWDIVFEDDFNSGKLDSSKWITRYYAGERFLDDTYGVGDDVQLFTQDNISFGESTVCLNFKREQIIGKYWNNRFGIKERTYEYTSALLSTAASFRQRYGKIEAKIKVKRSPVNQNFWMLGDMEVPHVDIVKNKADGTYMGHIFPYRGGFSYVIQQLKDIKLSNDYYIFTLEWTSDKMVWKINDTVVKEVHEDIPDIPMYILFSLGTNQQPHEKEIHEKMEIDWVRIYKLKD